MDMIGGLMKTTSRFALAAAAGLVLGGIAAPAQAADLGGNCCADLEERIAELEATTVRKGNRKLSLTLSGHVNRAIMWYDDGSMSGVRFDDNVMSHSRFRFQGSASIGHGWSAGYYQEFEFSTASNFAVSQLDDRGFNSAGGNLQGSSPFNFAIRQSHWWLKNDRLGTVSVGRVNTATKDFPGIELGNIALVANSDFSLSQFNFFLRPQGTNGREGLSAIRLGSHRLAHADNLRTDGVRYDTPTWMGFTLTAAVGDDYIWDIALRYSQTFRDVQVAFGIGYYSDMDENLCAANQLVTAVGVAAALPGFAANQLGCTTPGTSASTFTGKPGRREQNTFKLNASTIHKPTGIFVSGGFQNTSFDGEGSIDNVVGTLNQRPDTSSWWIGAGLRRNWFAIGDTSIFAEYGRTRDGVTGLAQNYLTASGAGVNFLGGVTDSELTKWGFGVLQNIDAAAMTFYAHFMRYTPEVEGCRVLNPATCGTAANPVYVLELEDIQSVQVGAIIRF
jgi:predicted porin